MKLSQHELETIAASNLAAIMTVLKYDGDIPHINDGTELGRASNNMVTNIGTTDAGSMFYIFLGKPHGDCEAYVWCDNNGMCTYFDFLYSTTVINNEIVCGYSTDAYRALIDNLVADFDFESGKVTAAGVAKFLEVLTSVKDLL